MKILLINTHHKISGGTERYYFKLGKLLKSKGNIVAYFSMQDKNNFKTKWSKYFVSNVDPDKRGVVELLKKIPRIFYSFEAKNKISALLDEFKPDIVHLNNIYYFITASILREITKRKIPVVQTVHDYQIICPNVIMYHDGKNCEVTKPNLYYKSIFHRCIDNSYIGSFVMAIILYIQNYKNSYFQQIDQFITPSKHMMNKLIEYGVNKNKIIHINNFLSSEDINNTGPTNIKIRYILFSGRITEAKGILDIVRLARTLPDINFFVAGNFDNEKDKLTVLRSIRTHKLYNLKILGFKKSEDLSKLISGSSFIIVPSKWQENQPYSILEAYAHGKPVIASKVGGIPEIVSNGKTGYLYNPDNFNDLKKKVLRLWSNNGLRKKMGVACKNYVTTSFGPDSHYQHLNSIYNKVLHSRKVLKR